METGSSFTFSDYGNAARRRLRLFLYVSLPILLIATCVAIGLPDIYRSSVQMEINLQGQQIGTAEPITLTTFSDQYASTLERNVLTRENMLSWIRELNVYPDLVAEGATDSELVGEMADHIRVSLVTTDVLEPESGRTLELIEGFSVGFDHRDPETAQIVAASLAEAFVDADRGIGTGKLEPVLAFLETQMSSRRAEITELESRIANFKAANAGRLPETTNLNRSLLDRSERELEIIRQEIRDLEQNRIFRNAQLGEIKGTSVSSAEMARLKQEYVELVARVGPDHPDLVRVKRQIDALTSGGSDASAGAEISRLQAELATLLQSYTEEHPDVARKRREIEALGKDQQSTINSLRGDSDGDPRYLELKAQVNAIETQLRSLRSRETGLRQKIGELEVNIAATPQVEREFLSMQRDLDAARETFRELQREYEDTSLGGSVEEAIGARLTQMNEAWLPDGPASPPRLAIVILGVFMAFSLGGVAAIGAEAIDPTVRGSRDIHALLRAQPIGVVPIVQNSVSRAARRRKLVLMGGFLVGLTILALSISGLQR